MITKEAIEIIGDAALKYGIKHLKIQDHVCERLLVEISFTDQRPQIIMPQTSVPIGEKYGMPTDDEMLFASSIPMTEDEIAARAPK